MAKPWKMPAWMEPYRGLVVNTGGNSIEEMMNDHTDSFVNLPRAMIAVAVKSQVSLLCALHERKMLGIPFGRLDMSKPDRGNSVTVKRT